MLSIPLQPACALVVDPESSLEDSAGSPLEEESSEVEVELVVEGSVFESVVAGPAVVELVGVLVVAPLVIVPVPSLIGPEVGPAVAELVAGPELPSSSSTSAFGASAKQLQMRRHGKIQRGDTTTSVRPKRLDRVPQRGETPFSSSTQRGRAGGY